MRVIWLFSILHSLVFLENVSLRQKADFEIMQLDEAVEAPEA